jgi:hypothetical protein
MGGLFERLGPSNVGTGHGDLPATPSQAKRLEEAGLLWPPPALIRFPAKDW